MPGSPRVGQGLRRARRVPPGPTAELAVNGGGGGMGFSLPRAGSGASSAEMRGALPRRGHVCHLSSSRDQNPRHVTTPP